jgi:hypothetical protein
MAIWEGGQVVGFNADPRDDAIVGIEDALKRIRHQFARCVGVMTGVESRRGRLNFLLRLLCRSVLLCDLLFDGLRRRRSLQRFGKDDEIGDLRHAVLDGIVPFADLDDERRCHCVGVNFDSARRLTAACKMCTSGMLQASSVSDAAINNASFRVVTCRTGSARG